MSNEPWITFTGGATGTGNGAVNYTVAKNTDTARVGAISVGGQIVTITQASSVVPILAVPSELGDLGSAVIGFVSAAFNRDGLTDYAVATADGAISVFLALSPGSFSTPVKYSFGASVPLIAADVNADGYPDLVFGVGVSLNNRDGTFAPPTYLQLSPSAPYYHGLTVGDFYQNGEIDIAAIGVGLFADNATLNLFNNDGTGHFTAEPSLLLNNQAEEIITTDINNDGYPDLVTQQQHLHSTGISVLLNQKNGSFVVQPELSIDAVTLAASDLNGDGYPDLVIYNTDTGMPNISVLLGNGDGTFGPLTTYTLPSGANGTPIIMDVDGDGKPDVVVPTDNTISFLRNLGKGALELREFDVTNSAPTTIAAADLNDDGKLDILANAGPTQPTQTAYWLYTNQTKQVCGFSVTPNNILLPIAGATTEQLQVKASKTCTWRAVSKSPWISIQSGGTGKGSGTVTVAITANSATTGRVATLTVAGLPLVITQPGN